MSWRHQMPKHETWNTFYWITWEVNTIWWWNLVSLCNITKENFLSKNSMKIWPGNYFLVLLNFQRILCKMESEEVYVVIWTNFDSRTKTYLSSLFQKFHFPVGFALNSLETQNSLELVFRSQFLYNVSIFFFLL